MFNHHRKIKIYNIAKSILNGKVPSIDMTFFSYSYNRYILAFSSVGDNYLVYCSYNPKSRIFTYIIKDWDEYYDYYFTVDESERVV